MQQNKRRASKPGTYRCFFSTFIKSYLQCPDVQLVTKRSHMHVSNHMFPSGPWNKTMGVLITQLTEVHVLLTDQSNMTLSEKDVLLWCALRRPRLDPWNLRIFFQVLQSDPSVARLEFWLCFGIKLTGYSLENTLPLWLMRDGGRHLVMTLSFASSPLLF